MSRLVRLWVPLLVLWASFDVLNASNFKTVCASGCDYTDLQSAINAAPTRTVPGDGAGSPWVIQVQIGVLAVSSSLTIDSKSYLTVEGVGQSATFVQANSTWFSNATSAPAEQFLTISNSDHVTLRNITIDAATNAPTNLSINQGGGGIAGVFVKNANPVTIDDAAITAYEWGLRDANPGSTDPANNDFLEISNSRISAQYIAGWAAGGTVWLMWNSEFRGEGALTGNTPPTTVEGFYVTGGIPSGAKNVVTAWGCHFHAESAATGTLRGVDAELLNTSDVTAFVGCTLHAKLTASVSSPTVEPLFVSATNAAKVDVSGSEIIYEGPSTVTTGAFWGVTNYNSYATVNLTGTSIIDRARDDSTTPPTLAGTSHKDVARSQAAGAPSVVHVVGSRAVSMSGNSSTAPQSLDTVELQSGTIASLGGTGCSGGACTVTLSATLPSNKYHVALSVNANETVWVSSKTSTQFTVQSSNSSSTASVDWIVRY